MKSYNFDKIINRKETNSVKWDILRFKFRTEDVLPMWVADMDFETPDFVREAITERVKHPIYGYSIRGNEYYSSIIDWNERRYNWKIKKSHIIFSPGIVPALSIAVNTLTKPGDKIVIQSPVYFPFKSAVLQNGRQLIENKLLIENGRYTFDFEDLKKQIDKRTKLLILSNPHNPGGTVWTKGELEELAEICAKHNIIVVSDEIHNDLAFEPHQYTPVSNIAEKSGLRYVSMIAPSKTFNLAGLSSSSVIIEDNELRQQFNAFMETTHLSGGNLFGAVASEAVYTQGEEWLRELKLYLKANIDYVADFIAEEKLPVKMMRPEATYLIWLDFRDIGMNDSELKQFLVKKARLGLNAGESFGPGGEGFARMNIACPRVIVEEAMVRLKHAFKERKQNSN
ncbi:MAG: PatB family C-S lyase [Bacteroidota bacterium]|nr:PatB family C-S lyase [Bacteroidota bacterium]